MDTISVLEKNHAKFTLTPRGIEFHGDLSFDEWEKLGEKLGDTERSIGFMIGDWINYAENKWGEKYNEAIAATGLEYQTLLNYAYVARRVQISVRTENLPFYHHQVVAKLKDPEEQKHWLTQAEDHDLSYRRLQKSINFGRIATEEEVQGDPADRGYVTYLALLNRIRRWWARETQKAPVEEWDEDRREGLKKDFKLILDIYEAL
ncbi:MAG: hypothetical protein ACK56K_06735 [Akkermansiaceae bacterium]|jgi:hypothetical protein